MLDLTTPAVAQGAPNLFFHSAIPTNKSTYILGNDAPHLGHQWKVKVYIDDGIYHESYDGITYLIDGTSTIFNGFVCWILNPINLFCVFLGGYHVLGDSTAVENECVLVGIPEPKRCNRSWWWLLLGGEPNIYESRGLDIVP